MLDHVCPMGVACAGGDGLVPMPAMLTEELITTES